MKDYFQRLWPLNRSLTGPGVRATLDILDEVMPTHRLRFATGAPIFDWTVPDEWEARDAYIVDPTGRKRAHFRQNNLHLVGYSSPFQGVLSLEQLKEHLHTLPDQPTAIPYLTTYYRRRWGFCLAHDEYRSLPEGDYQVVVDTSLFPGHLEIGEAVLPGASSQEVLFSSYICHPSLANNELSGPLALVFLYDLLRQLPHRRFTYRFLLSVETLGTLCFLSLRGQHLKRFLVAGYQLTCVGDRGNFTYKCSRRADSLADRAARVVLRDLGPHTVLAFDPGNGSDERQYCSPGFNLPVGSLMRTMYSRYPEYHTSLDNQDFLSWEALAGSIEAYYRLVRALEANRIYRNTVAHGEPQLGKRGLYPTFSNIKELERRLQAQTWFLNLADGTRDLLTISQESGFELDILMELADPLAAAGLIRDVGRDPERNRRFRCPG